jgi:hypothetical protein
VGNGWFLRFRRCGGEVASGSACWLHGRRQIGDAEFQVGELAIITGLPSIARSAELPIRAWAAAAVVEAARRGWGRRPVGQRDTKTTPTTFRKVKSLKIIVFLPVAVLL